MHCHHPSLLLQLLSPPCSSLQSAPSAPTPLFVQVAAIPVYMSGSRRRLMAYCFVRDDMPSVTGRASASSSRRTAAAASVQKYDLTTLPGFQPGNVMGVLASQATERAAAKAAFAAGGRDGDEDTYAARDAAAGGRRRGTTAASGGRGHAALMDYALVGIDQVSGLCDQLHGYGLRKRAAA